MFLCDLMKDDVSRQLATAREAAGTTALAFLDREDMQWRKP